MVQPRNYFRFTRYGFAPNGSITFDANGNYFGAITYTLASVSSIFGTSVPMPDTFDFSNLFDQYKILGVTIDVMPGYTDRDISAATYPIPKIYWYYDIDDNSPPSDFNTVMQNPRVRMNLLRSKVTLRMKNPSVAMMMYKSATSTGYGARRSPWIDVVDNTVPHYGIKYVVCGGSAWASQTVSQIQIRVRWDFATKGVR